MAIPSTVQIVVRTDGSDANGGGFVLGASGTDYSNQASAQFSGIDLVVSGTGATSITHSFVSTDVGNLIQAGAFFEIVSVSGGTATLDRTGAANGTWAVGGALLTLAQALTIPGVGGANGGAGMIVALKTGTYTLTTTLLLPPALDGGLGPMSIIGFGTAPGDGGTRPLITTSTNSISLITLNAGDVGIVFENINFSSTAGTPGIGLSAPTTGQCYSVELWNSRLTGFSVGILADYNVVYRIIGLSLFNVEIDHSVSHGISNSGSTTTYNCKIHDNGGHGFDFGTTLPGAGQAGYFTNTAFYLNAIGAYITIPNVVLGVSLEFNGCVFSDNTGAGIQFTNTGQSLYAECPNCVFYNNGTYGFDHSTAGPNGVLLQNCAFGANTTAPTHNMTTGAGPITLTADPFTARLTGNFGLNTTAGGGALLRGTGAPLYRDVGMIQHQDAGGGGGLLVNPGMTGGIRG